MNPVLTDSLIINGHTKQNRTQNLNLSKTNADNEGNPDVKWKRLRYYLGARRIVGHIEFE